MSNNIDKLLSVELLTEVVNTNATGIIIIDHEHNIIFWNKWLEDASLIQRNDAINQNLFQLFPILENSRIHKAIDQSISKGNASFISYAFNKNTFPLFSNGNKQKPLKQILYIKPVLLKNNQRYCYIQINDATAAATREQQLRKMAHDAKALSDLKSGFVSSVSHELRTPLTSIVGALGLLKAGVDSPSSETSQQMLNIASSNTERLLLLINDILDIEKIESGKFDYHFSKENINELIEVSIKNNIGLTEKYKVKFSFVKDAAIPDFSFDKDRITQVMNNLISNAAKFEPDNGTVEIQSLLENNKVRIMVKDHGEGIPALFQDKVFQSFTQADVSNTKNIAGTGLGLAISKKIIESHHGDIGFDTIENKGTLFYFTLPLTR